VIGDILIKTGWQLPTVNVNDVVAGKGWWSVLKKGNDIKVAWGEVADGIKVAGVSYPYGAGSCAKRWKAVVEGQ